MNKFSIISAVLMVLCAASVLATATINYQFNVQNVDITAYNCLDAGCNTVGPFSGSFPDGVHTSDGSIRISYPTALASPYGYAVYYTSSGYVPMEYVATWHGTGTAGFPISFYQIPVCRSVVDTFTVINDAYANVPLVIQTSASLDAITRSAFMLTDTGVGYVPPQLADVYYSADTRVTLTIRNAAGAIVNTQHVDFSAANGNPLFAGDSQPVEFSWTPTVDGNYNATIMTAVIDNQCAAQQSQSASSLFTVLEELPRNMCYTILNGLAATPFVATVNESVQLDFTKISNHANNYAFNHPSFVLTPVNTQINWHVEGASASSGSFLAGANADNYNPYGLSFEFTPTATGMHQVIVTGIASSSMCAGLENVPNTVTLNIYAEEPQRYTLHFVIVDGQTGLRLPGATIHVAGETLVTDANGEATTQDLLPGDYQYSVSAPGFLTATGTAHLVDVDLDIFIALQRGNPGNQYDLHFHVYDANTNADIQGASVSAASQIGLTDPNGMFHVFDIVNGNYPWTVAAQNCLPAAGTAVIVNADATVEVPLVCGPNIGPWNVTFHVYDGDTDANLPGATVLLDGRPTQTTNVFGLTTFNWFANGNYPWTVALAGYTGAAGTVTVNGANVLVEVPLTNGNGTCTQRTVTFTVRDTQGNPIQNARVYVGSGSFLTNANGVASFLRCDGTYNWRVEADGYDTASGIVTVAGSNVNIVVVLTGDGTDGDQNGNGALGIYVGSIRIPEIQGEAQVPILITFRNEGDETQEDLRVTAISTELGLRGVVGAFDLRHDGQVTARILLDLDGQELVPGLYPIRLTVSNDDKVRVVYRDLEVIA